MAHCLQSLLTNVRPCLRSRLCVPAAGLPLGAGCVVRCVSSVLPRSVVFVDAYGGAYSPPVTLRIVNTSVLMRLEVQ